MRVFVRLREMMATHKELALKLRVLEGRIQDHDEQIVAIFWCHVPQVRCIKCHFDPRESGGRNLEFQRVQKSSPCCQDDNLSLRRDTRPSPGSWLLRIPQPPFLLSPGGRGWVRGLESTSSPFRGRGWVRVLESTPSPPSGGEAGRGGEWIGSSRMKQKKQAKYGKCKRKGQG